MAATVTNANGLAAAWAKLRNVRASRVTGASAAKFHLCVMTDSKGGAIPLRYQYRQEATMESAWPMLFANYLKQYAGDYGHGVPCQHTDETYYGGAYVLGLNASLDRVLHQGKGIWGAYTRAKGGKRGQGWLNRSGRIPITWAASGGTYTNDLAASDANPSEVTSAAYTFASSDVGCQLDITSGVNFVAGRYLIRAVAAGTATLDRNCCTGGAGSAGVGSCSGAFGWAGLVAKPANGDTVTFDPLPFDARYIDIVYPISSLPDSGVNPTKGLRFSLNGAANVDVVTLGATELYNQVQTLDAGFNGRHNLTMTVPVSGYGGIEGMAFRTGNPGVFSNIVTVSGQRMAYLDGYTTSLQRANYLGATAFGTPDLLVMEMGYNDLAAASYSAASQTALANRLISWIDSFPSVPIMWVIWPWNDGSTDRAVAIGNVVTAVLAGVADNSRVTVVDCRIGCDGWSSFAAGLASGYLNGQSLIPLWEPSTFYQVGHKVRHTAWATGDDHYFVCSSVTTGVSSAAGAEPAWDKTAGNTTTDTGVVWTCAGAAAAEDGKTAATQLDNTHPTVRGQKAWFEAIRTGLRLETINADWGGGGSTGGMGIGL